MLIVAALLGGCSSAPPPTPVPTEPAKVSDKPLYQQSTAQVDATLRSLAADQRPLPERAVALARRNLGQPYDLYLLGEAPFETIDAQPVFNLQKSDCVVFLEHTLAMSMSPDFPSFLRLLQRIRYTNGEIGVRTRNHYTEADWNVNNAWLVREITAEVAAAPTLKYAQKVDRQTFFKKRYKIDVPTPTQRIEEIYIADADIASVRGLRTGDIFNSVKGSANGGGEFVHHVGFIAVTPDGEVRMIHSTEPRVREQTIASYIAEAEKRESRQATTRPNLPRHKGFKFYRLHDDALARLRAIDGDATPRVTLPSDSPISFEAFVAQIMPR